MSRGVKAQKVELRSRCLAQRERITGSELAAASAAIQARLLDLSEFREAGVVHSYVSRDDEVDTTRVIREVLASGRRVAVPVLVQGSRVLLRHAEIGGLEELEPGPFGLLQPAATAARWIEDKRLFDLILVPGLAFDAGGHRVGYGRGYYDRFLDQVAAPRVGLVQESFLVEQVPVEAYDVPVGHRHNRNRNIERR